MQAIVQRKSLKIDIIDLEISNYLIVKQKGSTANVEPFFVNTCGDYH